MDTLPVDHIKIDDEEQKEPVVEQEKSVWKQFKDFFSIDDDEEDKLKKKVAAQRKKYPNIPKGVALFRYVHLREQLRTLRDTADECKSDKKSLKKKLIPRLKMLREAYDNELESIQQSMGIAFG